MQLIRGTTPTIVITVQTELDLHQVSQVWIYLSQQNKVKVDKLIPKIKKLLLINTLVSFSFPLESIKYLNILISNSKVIIGTNKDKT